MSRAKGDLGEDLAVRILADKGYRILARNFRRPGGEIDIIAQEGRTYVFVEVKQRSSSRYGSAADAVDYAKCKRIVRTAMRWLAENRLDDVPVRFDVVLIELNDVRLLRAAFDATDLIGG